jgi:hypothetical protein
MNYQKLMDYIDNECADFDKSSKQREYLAV